jgi:ribosome modulation factor
MGNKQINEGYDAAKRGDSKGSNPYLESENPHKHNHWCEGWDNWHGEQQVAKNRKSNSIPAPEKGQPIKKPWWRRNKS